MWDCLCSEQLDLCSIVHDPGRCGRRVCTLAGMEAPDPFPPADPLGEALHFLRMNGGYYCRSELTAPWGLTLPPMPGYIWFHVVTSGRLRLEAGSTGARSLGPSDLAVAPRGAGAQLRRRPRAPAPAILELPRHAGSGHSESRRPC